VNSKTERAYTSFLKSLIAFGIIFYTTISYGERLEDMEYQPILVFESDNAVDESIEAKILQIVLDSLRKSILGSVGHSLYGSGPNFRSRPARGPLYEYLRAFEEIDKMLEKRAHGNLKEFLSDFPEGSISNFSFHLIWVKNRKTMGEFAENIPGTHMFNLLWSVVSLNMNREKNSASFGDALAWALRIPLINAKDLPNGIKGLYSATVQTYRYFAGKNPDKMVPLASKFGIQISNGKITIDLNMTLKPKDLKVALAEPEPGDMILAEYIYWNPPQEDLFPPVAKFIINRSYGENARDYESRPVLTATFGRVIGRDIRKIFVCRYSCDSLFRGNPFHIRRSSPTVVGNLRVPTTDIEGAFYEIKKAIVRELNKHMDLYIMLSDLKFDISQPNNPILIEDESRVPLVLKFITPFTGGQSYLDVTKQDRFGFNFMHKIVNSKASYKLGKAIRSSMTKIDSKINEETRAIVNKLFEALL